MKIYLQVPGVLCLPQAIVTGLFITQGEFTSGMAQVEDV